MISSDIIGRALMNILVIVGGKTISFIKTKNLSDFLSDADDDGDPEGRNGTGGGGTGGRGDFKDKSREITGRQGSAACLSLEGQIKVTILVMIRYGHRIADF